MGQIAYMLDHKTKTTNENTSANESVCMTTDPATIITINDLDVHKNDYASSAYIPTLLSEMIVIKVSFGRSKKLSLRNTVLVCV